MQRWLTLLFICCSSAVLAQRHAYGDSLLLDAQYEAVLKWADQYAPDVEDSIKWVTVLTRKAEALIRLSHYEEAERLLDSLALAGNAADRTAIDVAYGSLFLHQGLYDQAETRLESALNALDADSFEVQLALSHLGNLRRATGEYTQAEALLTRCLAIRQRLYGDQSEWIAASYNDLGLVYGMTDRDKALEYYERALRIYERLHPHTHPKIAIALTNIGFSYSAIELYGDATTNFEAALKIWESIYPSAHPTKAFLNFSLGDIYRKLKNYPVASAFYQKALTLYRTSYGEKHPELATVYNSLGNMQLDQGKYGEALGYYQRAIISNVVDFNDMDIRRQPPVQHYYHGATLLNSLLFKALALESGYYAHTIRMVDLKQARDVLLTCDTLIDQLRQQISNESDKLALGATAAQVYQSGVRICTEASDVAFEKKTWHELAFYFAEKGKSAVLLEGISEVRAKAFARIPAPLLDEEKVLRAAMATATAQLAHKPEANEEQRLRARLFEAEREYKRFVTKLEDNFPQYYNLKYNQTAPAVDDVRRPLDDRTAVVSYQIDETRKGLYIFVITRKDFRVYQRPLPDDLDRSITGLRNGLIFNAPGPYRQAANRLSEILLPHLPRHINDLVIIPTGRLSIVPFEALPSHPAREGQPLAYLIERYAIRYEMAAALILQKTPPVSPRKSILLCAPVTFPDEALPDLPGTETEVMAIDSLFKGNRFPTTVLTHTRAEEQALLMQPLQQYQYLHFATHGVVDETSPALSRIFLKSGGEADGMLYAGEIYNLALDAELVTLSACQTGLGKISRGEGVIGLSRALAYAGARRTMVSFWRVSDASTTLLMQEFYRAMLAGDGTRPAEYLRAAKLKMLSSGKYVSPYYWAPFVVIGF